MANGLGNNVPLFDEEGNVSGFFDRRLGPAQDLAETQQPNPQRLANYLQFVQQQNPNWQPVIGQPIQGFDPQDPPEPVVSEGFFDSLGNIAAASLPGSITGLAEKALHEIGIGDEEIDLFGLFDAERAKRFQPTPLEEIGIEIASFFQPLDLLTLVAGGGIGGAVAKSAIAKTALKKGGARLLGSTIQSSATLSTFEGTRGFFEGLTDKEKNPLEEAIKGAGRGALIGAAFGVGGGIVPPKIAGSLAAGKAVKAGVEIVTLANINPIIEGRAPNLEDLTHAAGFIVGMKTAGGILSLGPRGFKRMQTAEIRKLQERIEAGEELNTAFHSEVDQIIKDNPERFNAKILEKIIDAKEGETVGKVNDFIQSEKWRGLLGDKITNADIKVSRKFETTEEGGRVDTQLGKVEFKDGKFEITINPERPDLLGSTIMHEIAEARFIDKFAEKAPEARVERLAGKLTKRIQRAKIAPALTKWQPKQVPGEQKGTIASVETKRFEGKKHDTWRVNRLKASTAEGKLDLLQQLQTKADKQSATLTLNEAVKKRDWFKEGVERGIIDDSGKFPKIIKAPDLKAKPELADPSAIENRITQGLPQPRSLPKFFDGKREIAFRTIREKVNDNKIPETTSQIEKAFNFLKNIGDKVVPPVLKQPKNRFKSEPGKEFVRQMIDVDNIRGNFQGQFLENAGELGLNRLAEKTFELPKTKALKKRQAEKTYDQITNKELPEWKKFFKDIHNMVKKRNPDVGEIEGYIPQSFKEEVWDKLITDLDAIVRDIDLIAPTSEAKMKRLIANRSKDALKLIQLNKKGRSYREAAYAAQEFTTELRSNKPGFVKHRRFNIPKELMERDVRIVVPRYTKAVAQYLAEVDTFGADNAKLNKLLADMRVENPIEAELASKVVQIWNGSYETNHGLRGITKKLVEGWMGFQVGTKIGMGQATLLNLSQPFISIIPDWGVWRTLRSGYSLLNPEVRKRIRISGALGRPIEQAITMVAGNTPGGTMGKFARLMTKVSGFEDINRGLQYLAAATAQSGIPDLMIRAKGRGPRANHAQLRLKDFGIDYKQPLTDNKLSQAMFRYATDSQLQRNVLADPIFSNDPKWRPFFLFKRFGFRQMVFIKDMLKRELSRGNFMPMARLAAGGMLAGSGVIWATNTIKDIISNEPRFRETGYFNAKDLDEFTEILLTDLAYIGAFGMLSDMAEVSNIKELRQAAAFAVEPVIISDIRKFYGASTKFLEDWEKYGDGYLATQRNISNLMSPLGTYPREITKRFKTEAQKELAEDSRKGKMRTQIYELFFDGRPEVAQKRFNIWNKNHPDNELKHHDIFSRRGYMTFLKRKADAFAKAFAVKGKERERIKRAKLRQLRTESKR